MKDNRSLRFFAVAIVAALLGTGSLAYSQEIAETHVPQLSLTDASTADNQGQSTDQTVPNAPAPAGGNWHVSVTPYLWMIGVHGNVGVQDKTASVHVSFPDLMSHFRFGLMGTVDPSYKGFLMPVDVIWARLKSDHSLTNVGLGGTTANAKVDIFILSPKVGFRVVDQEKLKIDAFGGFRYWHIGENLNFSPSRLGLDFSRSQNWFDPLAGGRIQFPLSPKAVLTVAGDAGGSGTGARLEYQFAGLLGYKIKPHWTLQAGYRYLDEDYRQRTVFDAVLSGAVLGVTIDLK